ncbi:hypothetical protein BGW38_004064 [Lunasporangiospora selenospora]|uniref:CUE domain-containing protein n=1 Tax=Lunasporangiospora selenospora TaxID=979761 RepID=A0A9P6KCE4_9FUNG|nr:hypothetical protein BGW38_004064 [Lunasporangiospora selenospora]
MKTDFHLQLVPHLTTHHQFWRLIASHFAFSTSTEVFFAGLLLYHLRAIERLFGPAKYISFLFVSGVICTLLNIAVLVTGSTIGLNVLPAGPYGIIFSALYQFYRLVPMIYEFKVFGVAFSNKVYMYLIGLQLIASNLPGSAAAAICGLLAGAIYRSDFAGTRRWRFPGFMVRFADRLLVPLFSSAPAVRSTATTLDSQSQARATTTSDRRPAETVREYFDVLSSQGRTPQAPTEDQISTLQAIFPSATQEQAVEALNSANNNMDAAVQLLLDSTAATANNPPAPAS